MIDQIGARQRHLLELLLENKEGMCIDDIAKELNVSRNAVQQHISVLESDGYLKAGEFNKTAGRPVRLYVLTDAGINSFPKQYSWFSTFMLENLKAEMGEDAFLRAMQKLGSNLAQTYQYRFVGKNLEERRIELLKIMDELGFKTSKRNEAGSGDPMAIHAYNCVFHDLAQKHNEICQFDKTLITELLGQDVTLAECMAKGHSICYFKILS